MALSEKLTKARDVFIAFLRNGDFKSIQTRRTHEESEQAKVLLIRDLNAIADIEELQKFMEYIQQIQLDTYSYGGDSTCRRMALQYKATLPTSLEKQGLAGKITEFLSAIKAEKLSPPEQPPVDPLPSSAQAIPVWPSTASLGLDQPLLDYPLFDKPLKPTPPPSSEWRRKAAIFIAVLFVLGVSVITTLLGLPIQVTDNTLVQSITAAVSSGAIASAGILVSYKLGLLSQLKNHPITTFFSVAALAVVGGFFATTISVGWPVILAGVVMGMASGFVASPAIAGGISKITDTPSLARSVPIITVIVAIAAIVILSAATGGIPLAIAGGLKAATAFIATYPALSSAVVSLGMVLLGSMTRLFFRQYCAGDAGEPRNTSRDNFTAPDISPPLSRSASRGSSINGPAWPVISPGARSSGITSHATMTGRAAVEAKRAQQTTAAVPPDTNNTSDDIHSWYNQ